MTADERLVLEANEAFYRAINERDEPAMEALWAARAPVTCVHPGWDALHARVPVMRSWRAIFRSETPPTIEVDAASATIFGEVAVVVCHERLDGGTLVATNVFVREDAAWKVVHHQAGPLSSGDDESDEDEGFDEDDAPAAAAPSKRTLN